VNDRRLTGHVTQVLLPVIPEPKFHPQLLSHLSPLHGTPSTPCAMTNFAFDAVNKTVTLLGKDYSLQTLLRTVVILCGYLIIRPWILRHSGKHQERDHGREVGAGGNVGESLAATGRVAPGGEESDSDGEEQGWGANTRRKARAERKIREEQAKREEEEEDAEVEAMLEG
jgi:hypothetical protein